MAGLVFEPHPPNLKIYTTFKDVQMILKHFFESDQHEAGAAESKSRWQWLWKNYWSDLSQILTEVFTHEYYWNPKVEDSSSKIDGFMATYISRLKWAWQA